MPPLSLGEFLWYPCMHRLIGLVVINFCWQRHGGAAGVWRSASFIPNSFIDCGSWNKACTSLASFLWSTISSTTDNLAHQPGVLHLLALHGTHWLNSVTAGSRDILLPLSSKVSGDPLKKDATTSPSSGGSPRSEPLAVAPSSLDPVFGPEGQLGAGWSSNCTW